MSKYYLVDTNVLLAASGIATHLSPAQMATVSNWLSQFQQDEDASCSSIPKVHPCSLKQG